MSALRSAALLTIVALMIATPILAGSESAKMSVSVTVLARAIVTVDSAPSVEITAADLQRGYVDLATPVLLRGRTNSRRGYMLQVEKTSEEFSRIELSLPNATMSVSSHESWIQRPYVTGGESLPVTVRLFLAKDATAGTKTLPLSFGASAL
jgi:hypothetical protein